MSQYFEFGGGAIVINNTPIAAGGLNGAVLYDNNGVVGERLFPYPPVTSSPNFTGGVLQLYVATTGSDSNSGSAANPFATIGHAALVAGQYDYRAVGSPQINVAAGTYSLPGVVQLPELVGIVGSGVISFANGVTIQAPNAVAFTTLGIFSTWVLTGGGSSTAVTVDTPNVIGLAENGSQITFQDMTLTFTDSTHDGAALFAAAGYGVVLVTNLTLNIGQFFTYVGLVSNNVFGLNGSIFINGNTINLPGVAFGGGANWFNSNQGGEAVFSFSNNTVTNAGNFTGTNFVVTGSETLIIVDTSLSEIPGSNPTFDQNSGVRVGSSFGSFANFNAGPPTPTQLPPSTWGVFKDSTNGGNYLAYNDAGVARVTQIGRKINLQTANYTLQLFDEDGRVEMNLAGANTLTVPLNASVAFAIGTEIRVTQVGAGATTIAGAGGVTVDAAGAVGGQWKSALVYKRGTDEWVQTSV